MSSRKGRDCIVLDYLNEAAPLLHVSEIPRRQFLRSLKVIDSPQVTEFASKKVNWWMGVHSSLQGR